MEPTDINHHRIVLIGGTGFLGKHFATALTKSGHPNVISVSRSGATTPHAGVTNVRGNFADREEMSAILREGDVVVHLACSSTPATSEVDCAKDMENNLDGTVHLLEVCVSKKIHKFIFISSGGAVYGDHGKKALSEETPRIPIGAHGIMKLAIEKHIASVGIKSGLPYIIIRPGNVYGRTPERFREQGAIEVFLDKIMREEQIVIWGDGSAARDYVYINDVTDFLLRVITHGRNGTAYNLGSGVATTLNEVIDELRRVSGKSPKVLYQPARAFDVLYSVLDIAKAQEELDWVPQYTLRDGIKLFYEQIKNKA